jgi:hypothetical protein
MLSAQAVISGDVLRLTDIENEGSVVPVLKNA